MKFATFAEGGRDRIGLVDEASGRLHPIPAAADMLDLIERHDALKSGLKPDGAAISPSSRLSSRPSRRG